MSKTTREIVIDFFRPAVTRGTFSDVLRRIIALPDDESRNDISTSGHPIRMQTLRRTGSVWQGEILQIRMTDLPKKVSLRGESEDLDLADDQGLGQGVTFSYHENTDVLLVQRNKFAVSASSLERYLITKGKAGIIELNPLLTKSAYARLMALSKINKVSIKVANINRGDVLNHSKHGISELGKIREMLGAPTIELTASVGSKNQSLDKKGALGLVQTAWALARRYAGQEILKTIVVKGRNVDQQLDTINLLTESMQCVVRVNTDDRRTLSFDDRIRALLDAWEQRQDELLELVEENREAVNHERTD